MFFCHVLKAGGQTFTQYFDRFMDRTSCIRVCDPRFGADCSAEQFKELDNDVITKLSAICGHILIKAFLHNSFARELFETQRVFVVASIPDPIDRLISLHNYSNQSLHHPNHARMEGVDFSMFALNQPSNQQCSYLSSEKCSAFDLISRPNINFIALEDSVDFFARLFEQEYGEYWRPDCRNVTEVKTDRLIAVRDHIEPELSNLLSESRADKLMLYSLAKAKMGFNIRVEY